MDQTSLGRIELFEPVACDSYDRLLVHYVAREAPHTGYKFPVLCKIEGGSAVIGWIVSTVDDQALIQLQVGLRLERVLSVRLEWIARITFFEVQ